MKEKWGENLQVTYKAFMLEQANHKREPDYKVWLDRFYALRDMQSLEAAKCAALQGEEQFHELNLRLFRAFHQEKLDISDQLVICKLAEEAGLDMDRFIEDMRSHSQREAVIREHDEAIEKYGIFGAPTIVFDNGEAIFVKLAAGDWEGTEDEALFQRVADMASEMPFVMELKKPSLPKK